MTNASTSSVVIGRTGAPPGNRLLNSAGIWSCSSSIDGRGRTQLISVITAMFFHPLASRGSRRADPLESRPRPRIALRQRRDSVARSVLLPQIGRIRPRRSLHGDGGIDSAKPAHEDIQAPDLPADVPRIDFDL